jgi:tRNA(Arg) A34 adenosine deaminase TadA
VTPEDAKHLRRSFALAHEARARGDGAFGAVLLAADGAPLAEARNTAPTSGDASAHAEMNALRDAAARSGGAALKGATLYASTEPCPMCATAAHLAGVSRVVFGIRASELPRARGGPLPWAPVEIPAAEVAARGGGRMAVEGPCVEDEAAAPHAGLGGGGPVGD